MADNSIDLVVSKEAFAQLDKLLAEIKAADAAITALNTNASKNAATPSGVENNAAENAKLIAQMKEYSSTIQTQTALIQKLESAKKTYNRTVTQESVDATIRNQKAREAFKATSDEIDNYQRLDAAYKKAVKSAQDLGAQYGANSKQFLTAANAAKELDTKLKAIDGAVGKYGRNVGNYASGWNGLANSVNQLTREAPAFANSLNTGFMALSNNIPILIDEIDNLKIKNQELAASGKPTVSVTQSIISAFFSWQTAISLGVTLLTIYGGKLIEYIFNTDAAKKSTDRLTASLKLKEEQLNENIKRIEYEGEISVLMAKKQNKSDKEILALKVETGKKLVSEMESQYKTLTAQIDSFNNYEKLRDKDKMAAKDFLFKKYLNEQKGNNKNELEARIKANREFERRESAYNEANKDLLVKSRKELGERLLEQVRKNNILQLTEEEKVSNKRTTARRERMMLDFSEEKSLAALRVAEYEKEKQLILDKLNAYKVSSVERLALEKELQEKTYDVLLKQFEKEKIIAKEKGDYDLRRNDLQFKNSKKTEDDEKLHQNNIKAINNRVSNEIATSKANFNKQVETQKAESDKRILAFDAKMNEQSLKLRVAYLEEAITANKLIVDDNVKGEHKTLAEKQKAFQTYLVLAKLQVEANKQIALSSVTDPKERQAVLEHYKAVAKALDNISSPADKAKEAMRDFAGSFAESFASNSGFSGFLKMFEGDNSLFKRIQEGSAFTKDSWKADTVQMMEAAQEMYNFISANSQANFEAEYSRLEKQKEIALQFAGESDSAKKKVEEDAEKRRKEIAVREFKAKKQQALVNIAIDTAQAIIGLWAKPGFPLAIPMAVAVGALGALQMGVVASQKVPQYFEGTDNHPGGLALINDGKGANFKETVVTPDGKVRQYSGRDVLIDAPAGTQVFTHDQWNNELNTMMRDKGISMSNSFTSKSGLTYQEMDSIIAKHFSKITTQSTVIDRNGFNTFVSSGASKTIRNQSRYSGTGFSV